MNKRSIGNWLLTLGTVVASLAAANSQRASRTLPLGDGAHPGEFLARSITIDEGTSQAVLDRLTSYRTEPIETLGKPTEKLGFKKGLELEKRLVKDLIAVGRETVLVDRVPGGVAGETSKVRTLSYLLSLLEAESPSSAPTGEDPVVFREYLAEEVLVPEDWPEGDTSKLKKVAKISKPNVEKSEPGTPEIPHGTELTDAVCDDLRALGLTEVLVRTPPRTSVDEALADVESLEGQILAGPVPVLLGEPRIEGGNFVTADVERRIREVAEVESVSLARSKKFSFGGWDHLPWFLVGLAMMVAGIVAKRSAAGSGEASEEESADSRREPSAVLGELVERLEALVPTVDDLTPEHLKERVDPLLEELVPEFLESRDALARSQDGATFAELFSSFANGERKLSRAWSAAVDGFAPESRNSLRLALDYFRSAKSVL